MSEWVQAFAKLAEGRASRSTVLQPLLWMMAVIIAAMTGCVVYHAPDLLLIGLFILLVLIVLLGLVVFAVLVVRKPDLLRSEKFHIRKLEIEQASMGDNLMGLIDTTAMSGPLLPQPPKAGG